MLREQLPRLRSSDVSPCSALGLNWAPSKGDGDEEEPVYGRPDHWRAEGAAGILAAELCRKHGISDARRLKGLEDENRRLKKLLAESMLDVATLKEALGKL